MNNNFFKITILFLINVTFLFANSKTNYELGLDSFAKKEYAKSYEFFEKAFLNDVSNPKINFYLGRSAYELGHFEDAMIAYERVLILDNTHIRSHLELARTYIMLKMFDKAREEFTKVLKTNPPEQVVKNINKLVDFLDEREKRSFWNYYIGLSAGYDENINANPGENVLQDYYSSVYSLPRTLGFKDIIGSTYEQEVMNANNLYIFKNKNLFLESSFLLFAQQYNHYGEYNLLYLSATSGFGTIFHGYKVSIPLNYSKIYYGAKALLHSYYAQVKVQKKIFKDLSAMVAIKYQKKSYDQTQDRGRDVNVKELEIRVNKKIDTHNFMLSYMHSNEDKNNNITQYDANKNSDSYRISYMKNFYNTLNFNLQYIYTRYDFDDVKPYEGKRVDKYRNYFVSLGKNINKSLSLALEYKYIKNRSSYASMSYDKNIYNLKLSMSF